MTHENLIFRYVIWIYCTNFRRFSFPYWKKDRFTTYNIHDKVLENQKFVSYNTDILHYWNDFMIIPVYPHIMNKIIILVKMKASWKYYWKRTHLFFTSWNETKQFLLKKKIQILIWPIVEEDWSIKVTFRSNVRF